MVVKKKLKLTKAIIAASFFITIIAIATPVMANGSNRVLFMAKGDDLDLPRATNLIMGRVEGETAFILFHSKVYDESGGKVYAMIGMLKDGLLLTTEHYFYCPIFNVWWINVWYVLGEGKFRSTDTNFEVFFRNSFLITMPNTEGKFVSAPILMFLSLTAEYYEAEFDEEGKLLPPPLGEEPLIWGGGGWVLAGVIWEIETPFGIMEVPIGPASYLTRYIEI